MKKRKLRAVELVVVPLRGERRTYALTPITVGARAFQFYEMIVSEFENWRREQTKKHLP